MNLSTSRSNFLAYSLGIVLLLTAFPACSQSSGDAALKGHFTASGPAGVFFMTRYWSYTHTLEKAAWYFATDGNIYQNLESGLTPADLAAHKGPKGTFKVTGTEMAITWADGKTLRSAIERDKEGAGFAWDMGLFSPVDPIIDPKILVGKFEGGESLVHSGNSVITSQTYEFRADGTYIRDGIASVKSTSSQSVISGSASGGTTGTWKADGYTITLTGANGGQSVRRMAFPWKDDEKSTLPNRIYLGGLMLKRQK